MAGRTQQDGGLPVTAPNPKAGKRGCASRCIAQPRNATPTLGSRSTSALAARAVLVVVVVVVVVVLVVVVVVVVISGDSDGCDDVGRPVSIRFVLCYTVVYCTMLQDTVSSVYTQMYRTHRYSRVLCSYSILVRPQLPHAYQGSDPGTCAVLCKAQVLWYRRHAGAGFGHSAGAVHCRRPLTTDGSGCSDNSPSRPEPEPESEF